MCHCECSICRTVEVFLADLKFLCDFSALKARKASFGVNGCLQQLAGGQKAKHKHTVEIGNPVKKKNNNKKQENALRSKVILLKPFKVISRSTKSKHFLMHYILILHIPQKFA